MVVAKRGVMLTTAGYGLGAVLTLGAVTLSSCDQKAAGGGAGTGGKAEAGVQFEQVEISGKPFKLELALDDQTRFKGLSGRTDIPADGGMLFVFPRPVTTSFVMRDCPVPIDIIYLDATGRVVNTYKMAAEPPRGLGETENNPGTGVNEKYESRLKKYPSEYDTQFVIELKGNTLDQLNLKKNDKIKLDLVRLKKMAK